MKKHLINPSGQPEVLETTFKGYVKLKWRGYRDMTAEERRLFYLEKEQEKLKLLNEAKLIDVYAIYPSSTEMDGYGSTAKTLKRELQKKGVYLNETFNNQKIGLVYNYPYSVENLKTPYKIIFTMFESTKMPDDWKKYLNMADVVIVPSQFCREVMKRQFDIDPIVINLGYDNSIFQFKPEKRDIKNNNSSKFTFLHYDAFKWRKGWDIVLNAFDEEFKEDEDVELIFKTTLPQPFPLGEYPKVKVIKEYLQPKELEDLLYQADCFVFPSRGEGFGVTPLEAMATGLPVIVPNAHGIAEYYHWKLMPSLDVVPIKAKYDNQAFVGMDLGALFQPTIASVRKAMRRIYQWMTLQEEEKKKSIARDYAEHAQKFTLEKTAEKLSEIIKEAEKKMRESKEKIVFITEDTQHITGGRYYSWWLATALKELGHDVEIYTNRMPVFIDNFKEYAQPTVIIKEDLHNLDVKAKAYWGSPVTGNLVAIRLAEKYNVECYCEIFDPFPMMRRYKGGNGIYPGWDNLINELKKPHVNIISLADYCNKFIYPWLNKTRRQVFTVSPCVNERELIKSQKQEIRKKWITFISRLDHHKNIDHVLDAMLTIPKEYKLKIITSIDGVGINSLIAQRGLENRVDVLFNLSDEEKFRIIKNSRCTINASTFEGFGMWLIESIACHTPVVCYDFPTYKEMIENKNGIHLAKWNDPASLAQKLQFCLRSSLHKNKFNTKPLKERYTFAGMQEALKKTFPKVRIGVLMIALNEEKFISSALEPLLTAKQIKRVAVVEGCDELNSENADYWGMSQDNTAKEICKFLPNKKLNYIPYGWASNKAELRNAGLAVLKEKCDYVLIVDADEVWRGQDLELLRRTVKKDKDIGVLWFRFIHFWKDWETVTYGGQWDAPLFRFFKFRDKSLHFERHETEPVDKEGISIIARDGQKFTDIPVYHYGGLKDQGDIVKKLNYYKKRDDNLNVRDTWTEWKEGQPTQWTHGGGMIKKFNKKKHPFIIRKNFAYQLGNELPKRF